MLTIVGNNWGGNYSGVTLKSVDSHFYQVVNGSIDVVASGAAYVAAEVLELQVQGLSMAASAPVAVYATCQVAGQKYITIVKAWIKDAQTICIEKLAGWASVGGYRLTFQCVFFPLGYDCCPRTVGRTKQSLVNPPSGVTLGYDSCLFKDNWAFIYLCFSNFLLEDTSSLLRLELNNVPSGAAGSLFLVYNDSSLAAMGSGYLPMTLDGNSLESDEAPGPLFGTQDSRKFIKGAIIFD